jgi:hypothetical protein
MNADRGLRGSPPNAFPDGERQREAEMRKTALLIVTGVSLVASQSERLVGQTQASDVPASVESARPITRVRSTDSRVATLIARASEWSSTFQRVVDTINGTDGIVYVEPGRCRKNVRACMTLRVTVAGPYRILRIVVDAQRRDCDLMASIGHELWHAVEVLREPSLRSEAALFFFYGRGGRRARDGAWETQAATNTGDTVRADLRSRADSCEGNDSR